MEFDIDEIKAIWDKINPHLKEGYSFTVAGGRTIGKDVFRNMEILPLLKVGVNIRYIDAHRNLKTGMITQIGICSFKKKDADPNKSCSICPGTIGIDNGYPRCRVNSPLTYIKEIVEFFDIEEFEL